MREILFRGKRVDNGEWVKGALLPAGNGPDSRIGIWVEKCGRYWIEVIPETIGQYTGMKDRDGLQIFEGDILFFPVSDTQGKAHKLPGVVYWCDGAYWLDGSITGDAEAVYALKYAVDILGSSVIGNKHDNHGLLKEEA